MSAHGWPVTPGPPHSQLSAPNFRDKDRVLPVLKQTFALSRQLPGNDTLIAGYAFWSRSTSAARCFLMFGGILAVLEVAASTRCICRLADSPTKAESIGTPFFGSNACFYVCAVEALNCLGRAWSRKKKKEYLGKLAQSFKYDLHLTALLLGGFSCALLSSCL